MNGIDFRLGNGQMTVAEKGYSITSRVDRAKLSEGYDLDLLYVECRFCGKPVLWEKGNTSLLLRASGVDMNALDEACMILSEGCPGCRPDASVFHMHIVRVASFDAEDVLLLVDSKGNA